MFIQLIYFAYRVLSLGAFFPSRVAVHNRPRWRTIENATAHVRLTSGRRLTSGSDKEKKKKKRKRKRISYFTRMDTWRAVQKVLSHKMIVVDKGKTLKVCSIIAFLTLAEWLAELIANTITAVSNHISREWS